MRRVLPLNPNRGERELIEEMALGQGELMFAAQCGSVAPRT